MVASTAVWLVALRVERWVAKKAIAMAVRMVGLSVDVKAEMTAGSMAETMAFVWADQTQREKNK